MKNLIKKIISYVKENSEFLIFAIIGFICYDIHGLTLVTTFRYYLLMLAISIVIYLSIKSLRTAKDLLERLKRILEIYLILYLTFFVTIFIASKFTREEIHIVPLNNYCTFKTDAIYFRFQGDKFKRYCHKKGLTDGNNDNKYNVKLCLHHPIKDVYVIQSMKIVGK